MGETRDEIDNALEHYGVKGMKWGVRKDRTRTGTRTNRTQTPAPVSDDAARYRELKEKIKSAGTKSLSNQQLQEYIQRQNLLVQYERMNPNSVQRGRMYLQTTAATLGAVGAIYAFTKSPLAKEASKTLRSLVARK